MAGTGNNKTYIQPMTTKSGTTKVEICCDTQQQFVRRPIERNNGEHTIELPTQMLIVSSILFFIAIQIEVACSAAFACF